MLHFSLMVKIIQWDLQLMIKSYLGCLLAEARNISYVIKIITVIKLIQ